MNRCLRLRILFVLLSLALPCRSSSAAYEVDEILRLLIEKGELLLTLSGDKPISIIIDKPTLNYRRSALILARAQKAGQLSNPDLGWFAFTASDQTRFIAESEIASQGEVPIDRYALVIYSKSAIQRLLLDPQRLELLQEAKLKATDSVPQAVAKIEKFLTLHYRNPGQPSTGDTDAQHRTLGTLLGIPLPEVKAYSDGRESRLGGTPRVTIGGTEFSGGMLFTRTQPAPTEEELRLQARYLEAAESYAAARQAGRSPLDIVNHWDGPAPAEPDFSSRPLLTCLHFLRRLLGK